MWPLVTLLSSAIVTKKVAICGLKMNRCDCIPIKLSLHTGFTDQFVNLQILDNLAKSHKTVVKAITHASLKNVP